jgi:hypothetical protein
MEGRGSLAQIKRSHSDRYQIITDNESVMGDFIIDALPVQVGDLFPENNGGTACIVEISIDRDVAARLKWYADVSYEEVSDDQGAGSGGQTGTPPDQLLPEWSWSSETITRTVVNDSNGDFYGSSAGEPYGREIQIAIPVLKIERYELSFDPSTIVAYVNHVNESEFWGVEDGAVLMSAIEDRKDTHVIYGGKYYRKVSYTLKFAVPFIDQVLQGWDDLLVDQGTYYKDSNNNLVHFKAGGSETTGLLDGQGHKNPDPDYAYIFSRKPFPSADFSALNLGPY